VSDAGHTPAVASHGAAPPGAADAPDAFAGRPPIPAACVASMGLVLVSGVYLAAYLPRHAPLGPAIGLVCAAGAALVAAVVMVARIADFSWSSFFQVAKWALLGYAVIAGMLEYVFVNDGTRGSMLALVTISLLVFAVDIPVLLAFSVARFQPGRPTS
jgi:hypothetical protein